MAMSLNARSKRKLTAMSVFEYSEFAQRLTPRGGQNAPIQCSRARCPADRRVGCRAVLARQSELGFGSTDLTQLIAVVGSLTAGEIARNAISTICKTPNSTSCCNVLVGPMSMAARSSSVPSADRRLPLDTTIRGMPAGTKCPTRRKTRILTRCRLAMVTTRLVSMKRT